MRKVVNVVACACLWLLAGHAPSLAQGWPSWAQDAFGGTEYGAPAPHWSAPAQAPPDTDETGLGPDIGGGVRSGGPRPALEPLAPPLVAFAYGFSAKSIVIDTGGRKLYYVLANNKAYQYAISVGREGFNWTGTETVSRKQTWPDWYPPAEMRERDPRLPEKMTGGLKNPLGAIALYLGKTLYRIHGTNDARSIGRAASSGCFRMLNSAVLHLASITAIGTTVNVVSSLPAPQQVSQVPSTPPQPATLSQVKSTPSARPAGGAN